MPLNFVDRDWSTAEKSFYADIHVSDSGVGWFTGAVETAMGYAWLVHWEPTGTLIQITVGGRVYSRKWPRMFTSRGLVTVARRFARDLKGQLGRQIAE